MKLASALVLCFLSCACGPEEAAPRDAAPQGTWVEIDEDEPIELTGNPTAPGDAILTPPRGRWLFTREVVDGAEFYLRYEDPGTVLMQAQVFEVQGPRDPTPVLKQAVDRLHRLRNIDGVGWGAGKVLDIWGRPAAERSFQSASAGQRRAGFARLLLMTDHKWAFAWCDFPGDADEAMRETAYAFVRSLEPKEPAFYTPAFRALARLNGRVTAVAGEEPVLGRHVAAVQLCLEATVGVRAPLSERTKMFDAVVTGLHNDTVETRKGFRESGERVREWMALDLEERLPNLEALGAQVMKGLVARAEKGDIAAAQVLLTLNGAGAFPIGDRADGLSQFHLDGWIEMCAFLVSIARDEKVVLTDEHRARMRKALHARWETSLDRERVELRSTDRQWAALRRAWDLADGPQRPRAHFRRLVAEYLAPDPAKGDVRSLTNLRDLKSWMLDLREQASLESLLDRAGALPAADRAALFDALGVPSDGYQLGW